MDPILPVLSIFGYWATILGLIWRGPSRLQLPLQGFSVPKPGHGRRAGEPGRGVPAAADPKCRGLRLHGGPPPGLLSNYEAPLKGP